jgi:outer membrane protein assembly factor BamD
MIKQTIIRCLLSVLLVAFVSSCSTFSGWFGKKNTSDKPPEVMAQEGIKQLKKKDYDEAIETFEKVRDRYPYSDQAMLAQMKVGDAYFYSKKYDEAAHAYKEFEKLHPTNKAVPYCIFRQALCYYRQRSTIDRDQTYTQKAINEFRRLKQKYPQCEYIGKADHYLARCRRDLAEHEFYVAEFYYRTKRYQAAIERYQDLAQDYPDFPKKTEINERIESCKKLMAQEKKPKGLINKYVSGLFDARW